MSNDINASTPEDRLKMDRRARAIGTTCKECGQAVLRANLVNLKDGRNVCPNCFDRILTSALEEDSR